MRQFDIKELDNPKGYRVYRCMEYPSLHEIRDENGRTLNDERYVSGSRAEEVLGVYLTEKAAAKKTPKVKTK